MKAKYVHRFQAFLSVMLIVCIFLMLMTKTLLELQMVILLFFVVCVFSVITLFIKTK
jgi:hypothetical protein